MKPQIGVKSSPKSALTVFVESCQGGRKYMEDFHCVAYQERARKRTLGNDLEYVYLGIFDGHGGKEAAMFTKDNLLNNIVSQRTFWSKDDDDVRHAIKEGFITTHYAMMKEVGKWPKTSLGLPSTSGTTASVCFLMRDKYYIGHVGDSRIVLIRKDNENSWKPISLTNDHKPDTPSEKNRIVNAGGKVINKSGVERVVWNRPKYGHKGPIRRSTPIDEIPFLAVARSLGDLWSYNSSSDTFIVSPVPDVTAIPARSNDVSILLASDGLWNMIGEHESVNLLYNFHRSASENIPYECLLETDKEVTLNPAQLLVECALERWNSNNLRADNISVLVALLNDKTLNDNCERSNYLEVTDLKPIIVSTSFRGEYSIPIVEHSKPRLAYDQDNALKSDLQNVSACQFAHEYTQLKHNGLSVVETFNSSLCTLEPIQNPLKTINDNDFNCKVAQENFEEFEDLKSRNIIGNIESNSRRDSVLNLENSVSDIFVNTGGSSENKRVHLCINRCKSRTMRTLMLRTPFHNGRVNKRKWKKLTNSPPAKRLRSSSWSRAKISLPSILTRAVAASLLTRSRLRAIKCTEKSL